MTAEELAQRLNAKGNGKRDHWEACCPAHEDSRPSLSISRGTNGGIVLYCHAGCRTEDICGALGLTLRDLMPEQDARRIDATYDYTDENGVLLYQVVRYFPKEFRQRRPDGRGGWLWNMQGVRRVLYRLPAVMEAKARGEPIYLTEGEKDALALVKLGLCATTHAGGAGKWRDEYTKTLADCRVVMLPDQDDAGRKHRELVQAALAPYVASFDVVNLPCKDAAEWVGHGGTVVDLEGMLETPPPPAIDRPKQEDPWAPQESLTDLGNARRLVRLFGHQLRYCPAQSLWYHYQDGVWRADDRMHLQYLATEVLRDIYRAVPDLPTPELRDAYTKWGRKCEGVARQYAMVDLARSQPGIPIGVNELDAHPDLINCRNGTFNLQTQRLEPHNPDHLLTRQLSYSYDPKAVAPKWFQFLERVFDANADMVSFVQRAVGYSLSGKQSEQCFFFLYGSGANGKSVFTIMLRALFGSGAHNADFSTFIRQRNSQASQARNDLARLAGTRLVTSSEAGEGQRFDEALLKGLTGGEPITVRALYGKEFEFRPQFKLWLAANHRPTIRGTDYAIWRRVCLIPFTVTIPEEEQDERMLAEGPENPLWEELPGILNWALAGYRAWKERGLQRPPEVIMATEEYREDSDLLGRWLAECCEIDKNARATAKDLYGSYRNWITENGEALKNQTWFGGSMKDRGFQWVKSHGSSTYIGLRLINGEAGKLL